MGRSLALRLGIFVLRLTVAAVFVIALNSCGDERDIAPERTETTGETEYTRSLYGAAAQFPQGANPPIGTERTDAVSSEARIFLDNAERNGETITAFGRFTGGVPECVLLGSGGALDEGEIEVAGDTFLFAAEVDSPSEDLSVRCTIADRFFADGPPEREMAVE